MLEEIELDDLRAGELLVQVEACGVCHTDVQGKTLLEPPCVLGHEGTGTVVACGPGVEGVSPGDCVVMSYPSCGTCRQCLDGQPFHCPSNLSLSLDGRRSDGSPTMRLGLEWINGAWFQQSAFATHAIVPARSVVVVDPSVPLQIRAVLGCGILTGAGAVVNALALDGASSLAVVGAGGVGMAAVMAAHLIGIQPLIAVDVVTARLDTALELGATHALDASAGDLTDQIRAIAKEGIDAVIHLRQPDNLGVGSGGPPSRRDLRGHPAPEGRLRLRGSSAVPDSRKPASSPTGRKRATPVHPAAHRLVPARQVPARPTGRDVPARRHQRCVRCEHVRTGHQARCRDDTVKNLHLLQE